MMHFACFLCFVFCLSTSCTSFSQWKMFGLLLEESTHCNKVYILFWWLHASSADCWGTASRHAQSWNRTPLHPRALLPQTPAHGTLKIKQKHCKHKHTTITTAKPFICLQTLRQLAHYNKVEYFVNTPVQQQQQKHYSSSHTEAQLIHSNRMGYFVNVPVQAAAFHLKASDCINHKLSVWHNKNQLKGKH